MLDVDCWNINELHINYLYNEQAKKEKSQRRGRTITAYKRDTYLIKRQRKIIESHVYGGSRLQDGSLLGRRQLQESHAKEIRVFGGGEARCLQKEAEEVFGEVQTWRLRRAALNLTLKVILSSFIL